MENFVIANSKKWKKIVSLMNAYLSEQRLYLPDNAVLKEYRDFTEKFNDCYIDCFVEDFYNWYNFEYCRPERVPDLLDYYSKIIFAIEHSRETLRTSYLNDLYEAYEMFLPHVPAKYL